MNTYISTREELESIISNAVQNSISELVPALVRKATAKEFLTKAELMELTGWSSRTIQNLRDTRQIPYSQHGRKILYPYTGIMAFLKENHIKPIQ
jgi:hypothetical protein